MKLTNVPTLKRLLAQAGRQPVSQAGQNFLICPKAVAVTCAAARSGPRQITELGAGLGTLTQALLADGFAVRAIERDQALATILPTVIPAAARSRLTLIQADLRRIPWQWPEDQAYQLIGNIPYNLSGLILRRLTQLAPSPQQAILLLQKEVGQRLLAKPPHMTLLSLVIQLWGHVRRLAPVPRHCFWPQPQVDSQLLRFTPHTHLLPLPRREAILQTAKQFFQHRRKQMGQAASALNLPRTTRPQELTITQWQALHDIL